MNSARGAQAQAQSGIAGVDVAHNPDVLAAEAQLRGAGELAAKYPDVWSQSHVAENKDEIRWALSGNLCRCTGYQNIVKSVLWAAKKMQGGG